MHGATRRDLNRTNQFVHFSANCGKVTHRPGTGALVGSRDELNACQIKGAQTGRIEGVRVVRAENAGSVMPACS